MAFKPAKFYKEVRNEVAKVTWPSRKETVTSTIMVFIFVFLASIFLFAVDQVISVVVKWILGVGA